MEGITVDGFVEYLEGFLIPDLRESGSDCTAEDFETAAGIIRMLKSRLMSAENV